MKAGLDAEVAIVGAGPVGILLSILLGKQGRRVTLIDKWPEVYDRPRAVTMDHEVARILATLGIDADNDPAIEYHDELYYWKDANREDLQIVDWKSVSPSGWRVTYWFNQPELEARLLEIAATLPSVTIRRGWEAIGLDNRVDGVTLEIDGTNAGREGIRETLNAEFAIGCDGANSFVREQIGIENVDMGYFFDWLILDMIPQPGYSVSPAQWQLCDPERPTTIVPGGPGRRRWEFMVLPGESSEEIAKPESAWRSLEPWGLTPDTAELERSAVYRFQAKWAREWRKGRCLIAGDAAHLMPPFAGEGMCAGLRDAMSLGWRLNLILDGKAGEGLLDSYVSERIHHAKHYIDFSQQLGEIICVADKEQAALRDRTMKAELAARNFEPISGDLVHLGPGVWCENSNGAGELSTQGVVEVEGQRGRFDQLVGQHVGGSVGGGWMVIGLDRDPAEAMSAAQLEALKLLGGQTLVIRSEGSGADIVDVENTYADWLTGIGAAFFVLRPDFYVAATADTGAVLQALVGEILEKLHLERAG